MFDHYVPLYLGKPAHGGTKRTCSDQTLRILSGVWSKPWLFVTHEHLQKTLYSLSVHFTKQSININVWHSLWPGIVETQCEKSQKWTDALLVLASPLPKNSAATHLALMTSFVMT